MTAFDRSRGTGPRFGSGAGGSPPGIPLDILLPAPLGGGADDGANINATFAARPSDRYAIFWAPSGAVYELKSLLRLPSNATIYFGDAIGLIHFPWTNTADGVLRCMDPQQVPLTSTVWVNAACDDSVVWLSDPSGLALGDMIHFEPQICNANDWARAVSIDAFGVLRDTPRGASEVTVTLAGNPVPAAPVIYKVTNGGTIGVAGITYQESIDGGISYGAVTALGVATSIATVLTGGTVTAHFGPGTLLTNELVTLATRVALSERLATSLTPACVLSVATEWTRNIDIIGGTFRKHPAQVGNSPRMVYGGSSERLRFHATVFDARGYDTGDCPVAFDVGARDGGCEDCEFISDDASIIGLGRLLQAEGGGRRMRWSRNKFWHEGVAPTVRGCDIQQNVDSELTYNTAENMLGLGTVRGRRLLIEHNRAHCVGNGSALSISDPPAAAEGTDDTTDIWVNYNELRGDDNPASNGVALGIGSIGTARVRNISGTGNVIHSGTVEIVSGAEDVELSETHLRHQSATAVGYLMTAATGAVRPTFRDTFVECLGFSLPVAVVHCLAPVTIDGLSGESGGPVGSLVSLSYTGYATSRLRNIRPIPGATNAPTTAHVVCNGDIDLDVDQMDIFPGNTANIGIYCQTGHLYVRVGRSRFIGVGTSMFYSDAGTETYAQLSGGNDLNRLTPLNTGLGLFVCTSGPAVTDGANGTTEVFYRYDLMTDSSPVSVDFIAAGSAGILSFRRQLAGALSTRGIYFRSSSALDTNLGVNVNIGE